MTATTNHTATTGSATTANPESLLRNGLRGNAVFTGISGIIGLVAANPIAELIGLPQPELIAITGVVLLLYVPFLLAAATMTPLRRWMALTAIELDVAWVVGSVLLLIAQPFPITGAGVALIIVIGVIVDGFAAVQFLGWRRLNRSQAAHSA